MEGKARKGKGKGKVLLIASDEREPEVELKGGRRFEVDAVSIVDTDLRRVKGEALGVFKPKPMRSARLCGGVDTCLAIVELPDEGRPPDAIKG